MVDEDSEAEENADAVADDAVEKKIYVKFLENDYPLRYFKK